MSRGGCVTRRRALRLAAASPLFGLVAASCAEEAPIPTPVSRVPLLVRTDWRRRAAGPIPPQGDEGEPLHVFRTHPVPPRVDTGALVGDLPEQEAATYVGQDLTVRVQRLGAVFGFDPGSRQGSLGLITLVPGGQLTGHVHLAIAPDRWTAATLEDGELDELDSQRFDTPLVLDRRPYRVEVVVEGDTTTVALPDGSVARFSSEAVGRISGTVACWEFFQQRAGGARARLYESWAG